jgi:hypothetical protein
VPGKAVPHRRAAWQHVALLVLAAVAALALLLVALRLLPMRHCANTPAIRAPSTAAMARCCA